MPDIRTLGDLVNNGWVKIFTGPFGSALHKHDYTENGVTVVPAEAIVGGALDKSRFNFIGSSKSEDLDRYRLKVNDVVFARRGAQACGLSALVKEEDRAQIAGTGLIYLRVLNEQAVDPYFLFLSVSDGKSVGWLKAHAVGATMPNLNGDVLKSLPITLPSMEQQRRVSNQHRPLASKLRLNFGINQTLEQMAQAIFKSWFVDFEPVKAKIAAKQRWLARQPVNEPASPVCYASELMPNPPQHDLETIMTLAAMEAISGKDEAQLTRLQAEQPERYAALRATSELFPSAMQDSELGEIPEGWEVSQIGDEVVVVGGGTPSTKKPEFWDGGDIHWTTPKDLSNLADNVLIDTERKITVAGLEKISSGVLPVDTVLMSSRAPVGYLALAKVPVAVNQGYIAMKCENSLSPEFVIQWCKAHMDEIKGRASGTTFAEISKKSFKIIPVIVPPRSLVTEFSQRASPLYSLVESKVRESQNLAQIRDTLLPKLLSGELSVSDAESQLSPAESASSAACKAL